MNPNDAMPFPKRMDAPFEKAALAPLTSRKSNSTDAVLFGNISSRSASRITNPYQVEFFFNESAMSLLFEMTMELHARPSESN